MVGARRCGEVAESGGRTLDIKRDRQRSRIETIAAALGEARDAIEEIVEPYLMQQGFVQRTPRGRVLASAAYGHLGLNPPPGLQTGLFADDAE